MGICGAIKGLVWDEIINSNPVGAALIINELRHCRTVFDKFLEGGFVRV